MTTTLKLCSRKKQEDQSQCLPGCSEVLGSREEFFKNVIDQYKPYDFVTDRSFKYEDYKYKKKPKPAQAPVKILKVHGKNNFHEPQQNIRIKGVLDASIPTPRSLMIDEQWIKWIPVDSNSVSMAVADRTLENDISIQSSPYRTTEKSVLTAMIPIKPFPLKEHDPSEWNRYPLYRDKIYVKDGKTTGDVHNSMMHRYYAKYSMQYG